MKQFNARFILAKKLEKDAYDFYQANRASSYASFYAPSSAASAASSYAASASYSAYSAASAASSSSYISSASLTKKFEVMDNVWKVLYEVMIK